MATPPPKNPTETTKARRLCALPRCSVARVTDVWSRVYRHLTGGQVLDERDAVGWAVSTTTLTVGMLVVKMYRMRSDVPGYPTTVMVF